MMKSITSINAKKDRHESECLTVANLMFTKFGIEITERAMLPSKPSLIKSFYTGYITAASELLLYPWAARELQVLMAYKTIQYFLDCFQNLTVTVFHLI